MARIRHLLLLALLPLWAAAAVDLTFSEVDTNSDALVDRAELARAGLFEAHDLDGNGALTADQLGNSALFAAWDTDASGFVEPAEFYDGIIAFADVDADGRLDSLEFRRALTEWNAGEPAERRRFQ